MATQPSPSSPRRTPGLSGSFLNVVLGNLYPGAPAPPYPYPYRFLLNEPDKCRDRTPFLVLLVVTQPRDVHGRNAIRQTWGNESSVPGVSILRLFLTGIDPVFGRELRPVLEEESLLYHDILQQDFLDTYNNLTLKTLMGMEWVSKHCPNASYVMKADHDVFLNLGYLVHRFLVPPKQNFMTGYIYRNTGPLRSKAYKWYVPREVYPNNTYPPYCGGPGYVFSGDLASKIYGVAQTLPVINMEDSFVGICLHALGIGVTSSPWGVFNMYRIKYEKCRFSRLVMVHHYQPWDLLQIWPRFQEEKRRHPAARCRNVWAWEPLGTVGSPGQRLRAPSWANTAPPFLQKGE
ncbi:PREDICTED: beta-1,3-galactosyltransferase 2-like [Nipponia nippon]|uniref:beta-1,3-galactosyltransferase 2-like n=1 Tax=Nipponia nippon TaxID=128390 RepID=UPI000511251E|nr:PREDICTED: beta-1,3-galactosyltransferase 2-like [Nipponia nippon]